MLDVVFFRAFTYKIWNEGGLEIGDSRFVTLSNLKYLYTNARAMPSIAARMLTSQKRCTTCTSLQPNSSQW